VETDGVEVGDEEDDEVVVVILMLPALLFIFVKGVSMVVKGNVGVALPETAEKEEDEENKPRVFVGDAARPPFPFFGEICPPFLFSERTVNAGGKSMILSNVLTESFDLFKVDDGFEAVS
jgi:hypothetical protein